MDLLLNENSHYFHVYITEMTMDTHYAKRLSATHSDNYSRSIPPCDKSRHHIILIKYLRNFFLPISFYFIRQ